MKLKILFLFIGCMMVSSICFGYRATPVSKGIVVNEDLVVLAVNVNGPAYMAGIRPGDKILNTTKEVIYNEENDSFSLTYLRSGKEFFSTIFPRKIVEEGEQISFLIQRNDKVNLDVIKQAIANDEDLSKVLNISSFDDLMQIINTYSELKKNDIKDWSEYTVAVGGHGFGLTKLKTVGTIFFTEIKSDQFVILNINTKFQSKVKTFFGISGWIDDKSSGILQRQLIEKIYQYKETA